MHGCGQMPIKTYNTSDIRARTDTDRGEGLPQELLPCRVGDLDMILVEGDRQLRNLPDQLGVEGIDWEAHLPR